MFNELILGVVTPFSGSTSVDKNGLPSVMIQCVAGKMPNRNVLSGTVAQRAGFEMGKTYLIDVRQQGEDLIYGADFNFIPLKELASGVDIIQTSQALGKPEILQVDKPAGADLYTRKSDAVESERTRRVREGLYKPAFPTTSTDHHTAQRVVEGSTQSGWSVQQTEEIKKKLESKQLLTVEDLVPGSSDLSK